MGHYLGYFDVLPLTHEVAELLEKGKITEREIRANHILSPSQMKEAETLYVAGIAAKDAGSEIGKARAAMLISGLANYLGAYYGNESRHIIASAATPAGEQILKSVEAKVCCPAENRKDNHDLYELFLTPQIYEKVLNRAVRRAQPPRLNLERVSVEGPEYVVPSMLSPDKPFSNKKILWDTIRSCEDYVYLYDRFFYVEGFEDIGYSVDPDKVKTIKILTSRARIDDFFRRRYKDFKDEMKGRGIACELRVIVHPEVERTIHDNG